MITLWELPHWAVFVICAIVAAAIALVVAWIAALITRAVGRGRPWAALLRRRMRSPSIGVLIVLFIWIAMWATLPATSIRGALNQTFTVLLVLAVAWFVGSLLVYFVDLALARYSTDGSDGWKARRARTQFLILRRLTVAATVVIAIGAALLTLPGAQAVGATVLASAGFVSIVAGLAAQSTLANVFAGVQLAFNGAVRVEDIVVVDGAWGYIEEITLTYVVVRIWDERRLVLPSTYFTQKPYENWTRYSSNVLGTVFFDLDWGVDVKRMRAELDRIIEASNLWDGEASSLRVTDTVGGYVQVRALVSAADAFAMFDLCRYVREEMVLWLQTQNPAGLPRTRIQQIARDGETFPRGRAERRGGSRPTAPDAADEQSETGSHPSRGDETRPIELSEHPDDDTDGQDGGEPRK